MAAPELDNLAVAKDAMESHMDSLFAEATGLANALFEFTRAMNRNMDWPKKSSLQLRVKQQGLALVADWSDKKWFGSAAKNTRKVFRTYISKPKDKYGYTESKLLGYAQDWEKDMVAETERKLTLIRYEASNVIRALSYINRAMEKRAADSP